MLYLLPLLSLDKHSRYTYKNKFSTSDKTALNSDF